MQNEVWSEIGTFLNGLRCGNVKRESYIQIPEVAEAEEKKKAAQKKFLTGIGALESGQRECVEDYDAVIIGLVHRKINNWLYCAG